jgi:hypothetical protein
LSHEFPANIDGRNLPEVVSVSFKPEAFTAFEEWRMVLVRIAPGSRLPVVRQMILAVYFLFTTAVVGYGIGTLGSPGLQPETMALAFSMVGLLYPIRLWRIKNVLIKALRGLGPITVGLGRDDVTILSKNRVTRIDWAGVLELRASPKEIILRYQAGDVSWIPARVFADPEHLARFREMATFALAHSRPDPATQPGAG